MTKSHLVSLSNKKDSKPTTPSKFYIMMLKSSAYLPNDKIGLTIKTKLDGLKLTLIWMMAPSTSPIQEIK